MILRRQSNGELILIGMTDHSKVVGQLAAHWGNEHFSQPEPYESVVRAALYHDYGYLNYELRPLIDSETGETHEFRRMPFNPQHLKDNQWCIDWLASIDRYSSLIVSMHRTGLWQGRYKTIAYPTQRDIKDLRPEIKELINRNEAWQDQERRSLGQDTQIWTNYCLLQVWDLLGLYFCCQEPYDNYIEPVPISYAEATKGSVCLKMEPLDKGQVAFDPYPFNVRPLRVTIGCKRLPQTSYPNLQTFRRAYFQAGNELLQYELV